MFSRQTLKNVISNRYRSLGQVPSWSQAWVVHTPFRAVLNKHVLMLLPGNRNGRGAALVTSSCRRCPRSRLDVLNIKGPDIGIRPSSYVIKACKLCLGSKAQLQLLLITCSKLSSHEAVGRGFVSSIEAVRAVVKERLLSLGSKTDQRFFDQTDCLWGERFNTSKLYTSLMKQIVSAPSRFCFRFSLISYLRIL